MVENKFGSEDELHDEREKRIAERARALRAEHKETANDPRHTEYQGVCELCAMTAGDWLARARKEIEEER